MIGLKINELKIGQKSTYTKTISETDVYLFAGISGDINPAHINDEYAKNTIFKTRIAHGILTASLISAVIGMQLPGPGTIYVSQTLKFTAPVYFGDTISASVKIKEIFEENNRVSLITYCKNQNNDFVLKGEAMVIPPK